MRPASLLADSWLIRASVLVDIWSSTSWSSLSLPPSDYSDRSPCSADDWGSSAERIGGGGFTGSRRQPQGTPPDLALAAGERRHKDPTGRDGPFLPRNPADLPPRPDLEVLFLPPPAEKSGRDGCHSSPGAAACALIRRPLVPDQKILQMGCESGVQAVAGLHQKRIKQICLTSGAE